ncbi:TolC family outer membrane protein [Bartonella sp. DGB1]|uniref:TolC family outer membrane protein n=1 Tax=Bartonella sp. DGB1 TaxID=3239807 RepID=UPI003523C485
MRKNKLNFLSQFVIVFGLLAPVSVAADTLKDALSLVYRNNPTILSFRASLRASDEDIAIAQAAFRPAIQLTAGVSGTGKNAASGYNVGPVANISISQNIFAGFADVNNLSATQMQVLAKQAKLRKLEQDQLLLALSTYANVASMRDIIDIRKKDVEAMKARVQSNKASFSIGEGTRTAVSQAEAALARSRAALSQSLATLDSLEASYQQIIGVKPGKLDPPKVYFSLPNSLEEMIEIALTNHPAVVSSGFVVRSLEHVVKANIGRLLPSVNVSAGVDYRNNAFIDANWTDKVTSSVGVNVVIPLYQGGRSTAQVRKAKQNLSAAIFDLDAARLSVRQSVIEAWSKLQGAKAALVANKANIEASKIAMEGVLAQNKVGEASTLDVLVQRNSLTDARIAYINNQRDIIIASYNLLAAMGQFTVEVIGLNVERYDPDAT